MTVKKAKANEGQVNFKNEIMKSALINNLKPDEILVVLAHVIGQCVTFMGETFTPDEIVAMIDENIKIGNVYSYTKIEGSPHGPN